MSQRHDHRSGGGDRFNDQRSGPYGSNSRPRRGGGPQRRSYDNQGGNSSTTQQQQHDPVSNLKYKTVKLGDQPERLLVKMRETSTIIDSFLSHDFRAYLNSIFNAVPSAGVDAESLASYFKQQSTLAFDTSSQTSRLPSANIILKLFVDCITKLPHKHSYYTCLLWYMLHDTLGGSPAVGGSPAAGEDEIKSIQAEFIDIFYKFATVRVKGENTTDDVEVVALVDKPGGGISIPVKFEISDQRRVEYKDRAIFFMIIISRLQDLLLAKIKQILETRSGFYRLPEIYGAMRGLADFVNVNLLDAKQFIQLCQFLATPTTTTTTRPTFQTCLIILAGTSLMWLSAQVYEAHTELIDQVSEEIIRFLRSTKSSSIQIQAWSSTQSFNNSELKKILDPNRPVQTNIDFLADALESLKARSWVAKSLPRLYDSAKLKDFQKRKCFIPLKLYDPTVNTSAEGVGDSTPSTDLTLAAMFKMIINWSEFIEPKLNLRYPPRYSLIDQQVQLWRSPKCELDWRINLQPQTYLDVLDDTYQSQQIEFELMKPCDIYILNIYIEQTIAMFYQDLDLCAETLLLIPCKHDQFTLVLLNHLFNLTFSPNPALQGLSGINVMDGIFLSQLIRRLCILEKSLNKHVFYAVQKLLNDAQTFTEWLTGRLVDFLSYWITSHDEDQVNELCNVFLSFPALENCSTNSSLSTKVEEAYKKGSNFSALLRIVSLVISRVGRLSSTKCFHQKIPAYLRRVAPEHDILNNYHPYTDINFCKIDDTDSSRCRIPADLEEMKKLTLDSKAPLEADLLRDLLRLQIVGGRREQVVLVNECVALLRDMVGTTFIQSLREFTRNEQDELLFGGMHATQNPATGILKTEGPIVKAEMTDDVELDIISPTGSAEMTGSTEIVVELDQKSVLMAQPFPRFDNSADWKWTTRRVSQLFSLVIHTIGARTFSHFQKALEHYTPAIKGWKMFLTRIREDDDMEEQPAADHTNESEVTLFENMLIEHTFDLLWRRTNNITRVWHTLAHLINRDCVSVHSLIGYLTRTEILVDTIGGDYIFWDVIDLCVNNVSCMPQYYSEDITKNVMRDFRRSNGPGRKVEEDASEGIKSESQALGNSAAPAVPTLIDGGVAHKIEDEPSFKLSQEDLHQLMESLILAYLAKPNALLHCRIFRILGICQLHLNPSLFSQLLEKIQQSTLDEIVHQQIMIFTSSEAAVH